MHALRNIHRALAPDGVAVDTQPVSARPALTVGGVQVGVADMREWVGTVRDLDRRASAMIAEGGGYAVSHEECLSVSESFSSGNECIDTMRGWRGTRLPVGLVEQLASVESEVQLHQQVRLRLLTKTPADPSVVSS